MSRIKQTIYGIALSLLLLATSAVIAETEIRTLQSWNLPHPFQGPKSLTENVFALLIHPALRDYAIRHELEFSYSKEDDCLIVSGGEGSMETINKVLSQLKAYGHPYGDLFSSESSKLGQATVYRFKKICTKEGGKNLLRLELEYLPTTPPSWSGPVRYGMRPGTYETLGAFDFPATVTGSKEREIEGELLFSAKGGGESVHALSYRGMSKTDLRQKLGSRTDQASVYLDIPYKQLIETSVDQEADWALYRAGSRALKFLCPNYNNPRVTALFNDQHFRQILQKIVDLQYHFDAVGITDTGLQATDTQNVLDFHSWRPYSNKMREKQQTQILNEWKTWITGKEKKESRIFESYFYVEGGRLYDLETDEMPTIKVFFADNINDQRFFDNLTSFLADKGMIDLQVNGRNDFITADRFRSILSGQETLLKGQEGIVFDLAVPYNDHIENYFTLDENFFGLTEKISPEVVKQSQEMTQGEWSLDSTKKLGRLLREECPCLIIGQHPFYVYTRKTEQYQLKSARFSDSAPTSYRLSERIRVTSGVGSH